MEIYLKRLQLTNFKGIRSFSIDLKHVTDIYGQNGSGKTTLKDAFLWLFFGKDSSGRADFEIKTLDEHNRPYHKLDHEVEAIILVGKETISLRRTYKERWTTKRGNATPEFAGHSTEFFWNDVPMKENEYQAKVTGLVNESIFKLLSNTDYFNSLKWQDRRGILLPLAGEISAMEVLDSIATIDNKTEILALTTALNQGKTMEQYRRQLAAERKKLKDELDLLPSRIDEANRGLPEEVDFKAIEAKAADLTREIAELDEQLSNVTLAHKKHQEKVTKLMYNKQELSNKIIELEYAEKDKFKDKRRSREEAIMDKKRDLGAKNQELNRLRLDFGENSRKKDILLERIQIIKKDLEALRGKWQVINDQQLEFSEGQFCCPTCKQSLPEDQIESKKEELIRNFNTEKSKSLKQTVDTGNTLNEQVVGLENEISSITNEMQVMTAKAEVTKKDIQVLEQLISQLEEENEAMNGNEAEVIRMGIEQNADIKKFRAEMAKITQEVEKPYDQQDNQDILSRKRNLQLQYNELQVLLGGKGQREKQLARINELKGREETLTQELSTLQGVEYWMTKFEKAEMDILEKRINDRFSLVKFKLFEEQINGGEVPCCITLINGVPYPDANTASRVQAGLDIINTFSRHYGIRCPVWVDNRESVTLLQETDCQIINLYVSPDHKKLTVVTDKALATA